MTCLLAREDPIGSFPATVLGEMLPSNCLEAHSESKASKSSGYGTTKPLPAEIQARQFKKPRVCIMRP